jgi:hypothetical protein
VADQSKKLAMDWKKSGNFLQAKAGAAPEDTDTDCSDRLRLQEAVRGL